MHVHVRIRHWVLVWFYVGVVCGIVAVVNILERNLSRSQEDAVLVLGAVFWLLGGIVCWGYEGVQIQSPPQRRRHTAEAGDWTQREWHCASDFVLPGNRRSLLPPKY
jgi:predicted oxidoreductase